MCVCVGNGPSKMLFPNCKKTKGIISRISFMPPIERERENTGLVLRFLLAGRQAPPPRNAVVWWVRLTAPAPHEETSPQKGNLFATEERETLCGKWSTQNAFSQLQKIKMLHKPNLLCAKQGGVCVCVCVGNGPSRMLFPMLLHHGP